VQVSRSKDFHLKEYVRKQYKSYLEILTRNFLFSDFDIIIKIIKPCQLTKKRTTTATNYHDKLVDLSWQRQSNGNAAESAKGQGNAMGKRRNILLPICMLMKDWYFCKE
jgi:hypothetical protein